MPFPLDEEARDRLRAEITEEYLLRASHTAAGHMRSARCQKGDHRCRNNGTTCLCYCHDRKRGSDVLDS